MAMHYTLKDRYTRRALLSECVLLAASTLFAVTTFTGDDVYQLFSLDPVNSRLVLGVASILAFLAALLSMLIDWRGAAARHKDGAARWTQVVEFFRKCQNEEECWPKEKYEQLSSAYWDAAKNSVPIPDKKFNSLKTIYLLKIETSRMLSKHPGAPRFLISFFVRVRGTYKFIREELGRKRDQGRQNNDNDSGTAV